MNKALDWLSNHMMPGISDRLLLRMRWLGSGLLIAGYFANLYVNVTLGVVLTLVSDFICIPYNARRKYWDIVAIILLFTAINVGKLVSIWLGLESGSCS